MRRLIGEVWESRILALVGGSEVWESHGIGGQSLGLVSGVWRVGEGTGLGLRWRSLASVGGIWVLGRALIEGDWNTTMGSAGRGMVSRKAPIGEV